MDDFSKIASGRRLHDPSSLPDRVVRLVVDLLAGGREHWSGIVGLRPGRVARPPVPQRRPSRRGSAGRAGRESLDCIPVSLCSKGRVAAVVQPDDLDLLFPWTSPPASRPDCVVRLVVDLLAGMRGRWSGIVVLTSLAVVFMTRPPGSTVSSVSSWTSWPEMWTEGRRSGAADRDRGAMKGGEVMGL
jgi:hypothetical protein